MGQTTIIDTTIDDFTVKTFDKNTGEILGLQRRNRKAVKKSPIRETDEFIKVSRYLTVIFASQGIPITYVPISLIVAQRMEFKTNTVYLLKEDKEEIAQMLGLKTTNRVDHLIRDLKKYDIIRPTKTRGKYEVNSYLFSTGSTTDTRNLQAHFDFENDKLLVTADQKNLITGEVVRKTVKNYKGQIEGQMTMQEMGMLNE